MKLYKLFDKLVLEMDKLQNGEKFCTKDLMKGYLYNRLNKGEKVFLGFLMSQYSNEDNSKIEFLGKNSQNHYVYRKVD